MAIFVAVTAFLVLIQGGIESLWPSFVLWNYWIFVLARRYCKWANPDHARRWKQLEEALLQSPTKELMDQTMEFAKKKPLFAEDVYQVALKLVELDPRNSCKIFALEVGRIKYKFNRLIIRTEHEIEVQNDIDARC